MNIDSMSFEGKVILIIDDDVALCQLIAQYLENRKQCEAICAQTVEQPCHVVDENISKIDFVLLDVQLGSDQGSDFLKLRPDVPKRAPFLVVTGDDDLYLMQNYFELGALDYIFKPLHLEALWLKINYLFQRHLLQRRLAVQKDILETILSEKQAEEQLASHVYNHLAETKDSLRDSIQLDMQSPSAFNGDFFLAKKGPNGNIVGMFLDAMGHGLAAAISILPLASILRAMVQKGLPLSQIIHELNKKLAEHMPADRFVAGIVFEIERNRQELRVWNGGMPDLWVLDESCQLKHAFKSQQMPLAILTGADFDPGYEVISLDGNEHLFLCSDGLTEQLSVSGEALGKDRLLKIISDCGEMEKVVESVKSEFRQFSKNTLIQDDVSLCLINVKGILQHQDKPSIPLETENNTQTNNENCGRVKLNLKLSGSLLKEMDTLELLTRLMNQTKVDQLKIQRSFTVFAELVNNAFDHGVLKLNSELKNDFENFEEYLQLRQERMSQLTGEDEIDLEVEFNAESQEVRFSITDTGAGYDPAQVMRLNQESLSGRGLELVSKLTDKMDCEPPGNTTSIIIR